MRQVVVPEALKDAVAATGFSPAIRAGDFVFLTGATGGALDGSMPGDVAEQTNNAMDKVQLILDALKADVSAIVEMTSYHVDIAKHFSPVEDRLRARLGLPLPAWTAVEVAGLRRAGALVELRFVVHHPETQQA